jgi:hypothetical protein
MAYSRATFLVSKQITLEDGNEIHCYVLTVISIATLDREDCFLASALLRFPYEPNSLGLMCRDGWTVPQYAVFAAACSAHAVPNLLRFRSRLPYMKKTYGNGAMTNVKIASSVVAQ